MKLPGRTPQISRRSWLLAGLAVPLSRAWSAVRLQVTWDGDNLHVAAPQLHFLTGKPLERLKDGVTVTFLSQLTLMTDAQGTVVRRMPERLVVSYDVWEQKFSVARPGSSPRSASHLTAEAAEAWAVENMWISASGLAADRPFWVRLEMRAADPKEVGSVVGDSGISLTRLVEIFSRRPGAQYPSFTAETGPVRLADLKRVPGRHG